MTENTEFKYSLDMDLESLKILFGSFDESVEKKEKELSVDITDRDGKLNIYGRERDVKRATRLIIDLLESSKAEKKLDRQKLGHEYDLGHHVLWWWYGSILLLN